MPKEALKPDLARRLISTDRMMLAHVFLDEGMHRPEALARERAADLHPRGQARASGSARTSPRSSTSSAGEVLHIPSNLPHKAEALETTLDVDIFCPPRQDWLDGSDAYLRTK